MRLLLSGPNRWLMSAHEGAEPGALSAGIKADLTCFSELPEASNRPRRRNAREVRKHADFLGPINPAAGYDPATFPELGKGPTNEGDTQAIRGGARLRSFQTRNARSAFEAIKPRNICAAASRWFRPGSKAPCSTSDGRCTPDPLAVSGGPPLPSRRIHSAPGQGP